MVGWSMMRAGATGLFLLALLAPELQATGSSDDKPAAPRETLEALKREGEDAYTSLERRRAEAKDDAAKKEALGQYKKTLQSLAGRAYALVEDHPDDPAALDAVLWVVEKDLGGHFDRKADVVGKAFELLAKRWITSEKLAPVCYYASAQSLASPEAVDFLREAMEKSPYPSVRGVACLSLAQHDRRIVTARQRMRDLVTRRPLAELYSLNPRAEKILETSSPEALDREAESLLERVIADYGEARLPHPYNQTPLGEMARGELFRIRNLSIGKVAPEIDGEDMDGRNLELSDYRGKVVALVFWATWCGPCMGMVPHERELVKRLEGKPFVLLGVNGDDDREAARSVIAKEGMTWRSWWNGGQTGSIVSRWGVLSWPTVYILDHKGVIRYENVRFEVMDQAIDRLVKEAE